ncbi:MULTISPECIES: hypothetical protein [unclassified Microcoleus]|uniref:hypothetical protein n=1 Tax=unclassified Microcoleus TaxID=2642155 RepID=UPI002FD17250
MIPLKAQGRRQKAEGKKNREKPDFFYVEVTAQILHDSLLTSGFGKQGNSVKL